MNVLALRVLKYQRTHFFRLADQERDNSRNLVSPHCGNKRNFSNRGGIDAVVWPHAHNKAFGSFHRRLQVLTVTEPWPASWDPECQLFTYSVSPVGSPRVAHLYPADRAPAPDPRGH